MGESARPWSRRLLRIVWLGLLAYAGAVVLLTFLQDKLLFPATKALYRDPSYYDWTYEDVLLDAGEGEQTHAWWIPAPDARGVCLFSHGNAGNIADRLESVGSLRALGLSVLAYDYGGYGKSSGKPSEQRIYRDIRAAWRYLIEERGIAPREIVLFGRSMGGGATADLAPEADCAGVVLESTFTSVPAVAQEAMPFLPARWLVRHRFDNLAKVSRIQRPLLVIHSPDDTLIPYHHGQELLAAANEPKTFVEIHGDHNAGFVQSAEVYRASWERFLDAVLPDGDLTQSREGTEGA
ncbi:MAG: alpha/beta fold hydrolase [Candidatus Hydrogenedens sp.]|nr:alpha/beta fold hydrolase [Candidatus Hydrogenedens sp.]